jgi:hypothetical protein
MKANGSFQICWLFDQKEHILSTNKDVEKILKKSNKFQKRY